jgi:glycosyltransferase involved in cell wall biosynthesis
MAKKPIVSVLLPVYNAQRYVAEAVESILAQTFVDFELLLIDDGSTDRSLKILETYAAKDKRIRLTSRENRGLTRTLNEMIDQAEGEFVARMDADDIALPNRFARQVEFLQNNPNVNCVGSAYQFIDEQGRMLLTGVEPENNEEIQRGLLAGFAIRMLHPSIMIRRASLIEIGGYDETRVAEDLDLYLRLGEIGELANLKEVLMKYRIQMDSVCARNPSVYLEDARKVCELAWQRRGIEGRFEAEQDGPIRPGKDRFSRHPFLVKYGWWAFNSRQRQTAIIYAMRAIAALPFKFEGWKLLACAVIKPLPNPEYS